MSVKILVYRFSSFGDVLISVPVIMSALLANPELTIVFATRQRFTGYFPEHARLRMIGLNLENDYKGLRGGYKLFRFLRSKGEYTAVIDLHNVLRSQLLNIFFRFQKQVIFKLNKNKKQKREYISGKSRKVIQSTMDSYLKVFKKAGFEFLISSPAPLYSLKKSSVKKSDHSFQIGLAPFSKHATKLWPLQKFTELIEILNDNWDIRFYILGSKEEHKAAVVLESSNVMNLCGDLNPEDEISLIRELDIIVSMDSANMHLADILGTPVISIWGGTHPDMGFRPAFQSKDDIISSSINLDCRPCSVFGKDGCKLLTDPYICMESIQAKQIAEQISTHLGKKY